MKTPRFVVAHGMHAETNGTTPPAGALIPLADHTLLLEAAHPGFEAARVDVARFADLEKTPEHVHTYRVTRLSLWNAAAAGLATSDVEAALETHSRYPPPENLIRFIQDTFARYGRLRLVPHKKGLALTSEDEDLLRLVTTHPKTKPYVGTPVDKRTLTVHKAWRGHLKKALLEVGYPCHDLAGYVTGDPLKIAMRKSARTTGEPFALRDYQQEAADAFWCDGAAEGGQGVLVLPCGAGKTVIGLAAAAHVGERTLIVCTNVTAARQWIREILDKTTATPDMVGEYSGETKQLRQITVATYQMLCWRPDKRADTYPHMQIFNEHNWGLIIYDEVHLLPAPVFRVTAEIQARRRLGLTATLVREDGREGDVFSLIGPKRYDAPWKEMESRGWIATATCYEVRVPMSRELKRDYAVAPQRRQFRLASENPDKVDVLKAILARHPDDRVLIMGQYLAQLRQIAAAVDAPLITGATKNQDRDRLYERFRNGKTRVLVASRVANFAIDLPDANVAIEVSGTFGSRQEEAQRLGRILRPKKGRSTATFYALVTPDSVEEDFAHRRQLFLVEQGYPYEVIETTDNQILEATP